MSNEDVNIANKMVKRIDNKDFKWFIGLHVIIKTPF